MYVSLQCQKDPTTSKPATIYKKGGASGESATRIAINRSSLGLEIALADSTDGANPVVGDVLKGCSSGNAAIRISYRGVIDVAADFANVLHKLELFSY